MGSFVNLPGVVCAIGQDRHHRIIDLLEQGRDLSTVMRPPRSEIRGEDLTCVGIDREMELSPNPVSRRFSQIPDMNAEPRTVDDQMDRPIRGEPTKSNVSELLQSPRQPRVIRNREIHLEQVCQGTEEVLGLAKRKMKDHADRQRCLDGDVRIRALPAGPTSGRRPPRVERGIRDPDGEVASSL